MKPITVDETIEGALIRRIDDAAEMLDHLRSRATIQCGMTARARALLTLDKIIAKLGRVLDTIPNE